jgi:hypothetical protein
MSTISERTETVGTLKQYAPSRKGSTAFCWIELADGTNVLKEVTSMARLIRKPRSKFWFACFRDANGRQRRKSTKTSDRKKAIKIAEQYEQVAQRQTVKSNYFLRDMSRSTLFQKRWDRPQNKKGGLRNRSVIAKQRFGTSDEVARAARFLLSEDSSNFTDMELIIDGGVRLN